MLSRRLRTVEVHRTRQAATDRKCEASARSVLADASGYDHTLVPRQRLGTRDEPISGNAVDAKRAEQAERLNGAKDQGRLYSTQAGVGRGERGGQCDGGGRNSGHPPVDSKHCPKGGCGQAKSARERKDLGSGEP